jgi:hypothetical protein
MPRSLGVPPSAWVNVLRLSSRSALGRLRLHDRMYAMRWIRLGWRESNSGSKSTDYFWKSIQLIEPLRDGKLWLPVSVTLYLQPAKIDNEPLVTGQLSDAAVLVTGGCGVCGCPLSDVVPDA